MRCVQGRLERCESEGELSEGFFLMRLRVLKKEKKKFHV